MSLENIFLGIVVFTLIAALVDTIVKAGGKNQSKKETGMCRQMRRRLDREATKA